MCTAISFLTKDHYFGRNLDLEYSYDEMIAITPRRFPFPFRHTNTLNPHFSLIGMAYIQDKYPLYYEATNEVGLSMAGLDFPEYTDYKQKNPEKDNITPFEFIPWILGQCKSVSEAEALLHNINLLDENFSAELPLSPLHWIISDSISSITIESLKDELKVYKNPLGVLTNTPTFDEHLSDFNPSAVPPGGWSSSARFSRASYVKLHSVCENSESESVSQFFHILSAVEQPKGWKVTDDYRYKHTIYSSCCNTTKGIYYYKTYNNSQITAVDMHHENLDSTQLISYPLIKTQQIRIQNR